MPMTRKELSDALNQFPETATVIIRLGLARQGDYDVLVDAEDFVPADIETNPSGRIINGLVLLVPGATR